MAQLFLWEKSGLVMVAVQGPPPESGILFLGRKVMCAYDMRYESNQRISAIVYPLLD